MFTALNLSRNWDGSLTEVLFKCSWAQWDEKLSIFISGRKRSQTSFTLTHYRAMLELCSNIKERIERKTLGKLWSARGEEKCSGNLSITKIKVERMHESNCSIITFDLNLLKCSFEWKIDFVAWWASVSRCGCVHQSIQKLSQTSNLLLWGKWSYLKRNCRMRDKFKLKKNILFRFFFISYLIEF